jgi:hypothetical protein
VDPQLAHVRAASVRRRDLWNCVVELVQGTGRHEVVGWPSDFHVDGRGLQTSVAKKFLNAANVVTVLKAMGRETMAQRMRSGTFLDPRNAHGSLHDSLSRAGAQVAITCCATLARKNKIVRGETLGQFRQQGFITNRQRHLAICASLTLPDINHSTIEVHVPPSHSDDFAHPHPRGVHQPEQQLVSLRGRSL